jgi:hypothetical protein
MKIFTLRSAVLFCTFVTLIAFGLSQIAAHVGPAVAVALFFAVNFACAPTGGFKLCLTAFDIAKLNSADDATALIEENRNAAPELTIAPGFEIKGTSFDTVIRTSYPEGGFKPLGGGVALGVNNFTNKKVEVYNYDNPLQEKADIVKSHRRGSAMALTLASSGAINGAMQLLGRTLYYGARSFGGGSDAHPGLIDLYDSANKTIDATGTAANTGSSVWFIKWGQQEDGNVSYVFGNDRGFTLREWLLQQIQTNPGSSPAKYTDVWTNSLACAVGIQLTNIHAVGRIKNLTEDSGKGLTDLLGYRMLETFPVGWQPDVALMTKRGRRQLQVSRTTSLAVTAPLPIDIAGVPIVVTDSILNTEAIA